MFHDLFRPSNLLSITHSFVYLRFNSRQFASIMFYEVPGPSTVYFGGTRNFFFSPHE